MPGSGRGNEGTDGILVLAPGRPCELTALAGDDVRVFNAWSDVRSELLANPGPSGLVLCGRVLDVPKARTLAAVWRRGLGVPTVLCWLHPAPDSVRCALELSADGVDLALTENELVLALRRLASSAFPHQVSSYLLARLHLEDPTLRDFVRLLAAGGPALTESVSQLAQRLRVPVSTLYHKLKTAGAPPVGRWQLLFRLLRASSVLQAGGSQQDAAFRAELADSKSLRRRLHIHMSTNVREVCERPGWRWLVDRWIDGWRRVGP